jgi:hypothetical protein
VLNGHYGDHQLAVALQLQLVARTQVSCELLQDLTAAVEQLAHHALVGAAQGLHIEGGSLFICQWSEGQDMKQHLLMDSNRYLSEALNQALKLETAKVAAGLPLKLW